MMPGLNGPGGVVTHQRAPGAAKRTGDPADGNDAKQEIVEGPQAGAYYYLTKPFDEDMLLSVLSTAVNDRMRYRCALAGSDVAARTFDLMREGAFTFKTLHSARDLATVLANACPDPRRVVIGLTELLVNAVEHGNLEISYAEKGLLQDQGQWETEVARRLSDPSICGQRGGGQVLPRTGQGAGGDHG